MGRSFSIDIKGFTSDKLERFVRESVPKTVQQAQSSAINTVARTIRARAVRGISNSSGVKPQKIIRQRTAIHRAGKSSTTAVVYFRYAPLPAEIVVGSSGLRWNRRMRGVKAGRRFYEGAFAAQPRVGKHRKRQRVYKRVSRTGSNREDLRPQYIQLKPYAGILNTVGIRVVNQRLEKEFVSQFNWRLQKELSKLKG